MQLCEKIKDNGVLQLNVTLLFLYDLETKNFLIFHINVKLFIRECVVTLLLCFCICLSIMLTLILFRNIDLSDLGFYFFKIVIWLIQHQQRKWLDNYVFVVVSVNGNIIARDMINSTNLYTDSHVTQNYSQMSAFGEFSIVMKLGKTIHFEC